jgi:hypothetical protein
MWKVSLFALVVLVLSVSNVAFGQNAYLKGDKLLHAGLGFGLAGIYGPSTLPPISIGYEYGFEDKISLGGIAGFAGSKYGSSYGDYTYSYFIVGGRGGYHFLENDKKLDAYAGVMLGYSIVSFSKPSALPIAGIYNPGGSYLFIGFYGGVRYYFSPDLGVYGELGYGLGFFNIGVAYKLK